MKILLIEPNKTTRDMIYKYFKYFGHDIVCIEENYELSAEVILEDKPDLVLMEIMLPGKNGVEVLKDIRGKTAAIVMVISNATDDLYYTVGLESGADGYIRKPFRPQVLKTNIDALFRLRQKGQNRVNPTWVNVYGRQ